jgi:spore coat polysaccharide biosynthesis protein SpsF
MARKIYSALYKNNNEIFHLNDILHLIEQYPEISAINKNEIRSSMYNQK